MISNFHTHTYLCNHAEGAIMDYIQVAQSASCAALGFSDHCPYPLDDRDTWPEIRMKSDQLLFYVSEINSKKNIASFPLYVGLECEWDEYYYKWLDTLKKDFNLDYLVFGSHWLTLKKNNKIIHKYVPTISAFDEFKLYINQTIEGIQSGLFKFLAHPDLPLAKGLIWDDMIAFEFEKLIDAAVKYNMPLEINGLGMHKPMIHNLDGTMRYQYPVDEFWQLAKTKGAKIICNSDAHSPQQVIDFAQSARDYAKSHDIKILELKW